MSQPPSLVWRVNDSLNYSPTGTTNHIRRKTDGRKHERQLWGYLNTKKQTLNLLELH